VPLQGASVAYIASKHGQAGLTDALRQELRGRRVRVTGIYPPFIRDISPLDEEWDTVPSRTKGEMVTNRDIVDAVIYAITRPRHVTIASMVIDSDSQGMDYRSHIRS